KYVSDDRRTNPGVPGTHETAQQVLAIAGAGHRHDDRWDTAGRAAIHAGASAAASGRRRPQFHTDIPGDGAAKTAGAESQGGAPGHARVHAEWRSGRNSGSEPGSVAIGR